MTEQEIKQQMQTIQIEFMKVILGVDDKTPAAILIAVCTNLIGIIVEASGSTLAQPTADLLRDCANRLEAAACTDAQASVH